MEDRPFQKRPLSERMAQYALMQQRYPSTGGTTRALFVVLEPTKGQMPLRGIKTLLAFRGTHTFNDVIYGLRTRMKLAPSEALFLFVMGSIMIPPNRTIADVHRDYVSAEDGFLYISYCREHTFGTSCV